MNNKFLNFLSDIYSCLSYLERLFFKIFSFLVYRPKAKVISIGNISMGGTGKTPVLFELLNEINKKTCVLTRGYRCPWERSFYFLSGKGEHPFELTDEALMANKRFPDIPIFIGKNRHHSAIIAEDNLKPEIILLDDGFQYRRLKKDYNILLWDAMSKPEEAFTVPKGKLREPFEHLFVADVILLTRCESVSSEQVDYWENRIKEVAPNAKLIKVKTVCDGLFDTNGNKFEDRNYKYLAFSGIGRPDGFYSQLRQLGCCVAIKREFRDHYRYTEDDFKKLSNEAKINNLRLVCTEKDSIKIPDKIASEMDLLVLRIRTVPVNGLKFTDLIHFDK